MLAKKLEGAALATQPVYVEDVVSTYLYSGINNNTQKITNGIDLAGKGGLVWIKPRNVPPTGAVGHILVDSARGNKYLSTNKTNAQSSIASFNFASDGFTLPDDYLVNESGGNYVSWTFRKQPKFFDVVTYTGNGAGSRAISHALGSAPGCMIVKRTNTTGDWAVYHRATSATPWNDVGFLNLTDAWYVGAGAGFFGAAPTSTTFTVNSNLNNNGDTYVAYLFAHNAGGFGLSGTDNVISCGSFTADGSGNATVTLGYEPQWVLYKQTTGTAGWNLLDTMRGMSYSSNAYLAPNSSGAESVAAGDYLTPTATGFQGNNGAFANSTPYIYIAIRRGPMKTPTSGESVFSPTYYSGDVTNNRLVNTGIVTDGVFVRNTNNVITGGFRLASRLTGDPYLQTAATSAEVTSATNAFMTPTSGVGNSFSAMNGFGVGTDATAYLNNSTNNIAEAFKRAPGFFDVVCYTGDGVAGRTVAHNLGVAPELMIVKNRSAASTWYVYPNNNNARLSLNATSALATPTSIWNTTSPTSTVFTVGSLSDVNGSGNSLVAYLFASCPGVSKVGSYTGSGTTKQIDCGFTGGARFVLIKRTDSTGDWYVWDSARGIVAGNDPYLLLNSTAAEVTTTDYIDTYSAGFEISSTAPAAINANGGTFIFLAIA